MDSPDVHRQAAEDAFRADLLRHRLAAMTEDQRLLLDGLPGDLRTITHDGLACTVITHKDGAEEHVYHEWSPSHAVAGADVPGRWWHRTDLGWVWLASRVAQLWSQGGSNP